VKTIVIFIPWFDPSYKAGGPVQSIINLINNNNENISYRIFTGVKDVDGSEISVSEKNKWLPYNDYTQVWYASSNYAFWDFRKQISIIKPDNIFITGIFSLTFNILPLLFLKSKNKILSVRGMLHPGALTQKKIKKKIFLFFLKILQIQNKISFHATDKKESLFIKDIFGEKVNIFVADNLPKKINHSGSIQKAENQLVLITVALISPMKNVDLVIKSLFQSKAQIEYHIIGSVKDKAYWNLCLELIKLLPENIKVIFHGEQHPNKIYAYLQKAHVFIMPSKSENYGHAIIEGLQSGLPVITSNFTPWNQLKENKSGYNVDLNIASLFKAISMFSEMNQHDYDDWRRATSLYVAKAINLSEIKHQYSIMFGNQK